MCDWYVNLRLMFSVIIILEIGNSKCRPSLKLWRSHWTVWPSRCRPRLVIFGLVIRPSTKYLRLGDCFIVVCLFVCLLVSRITQITLRIFTKFGGKVSPGPKKKRLDFGGNPDHVTLGLGLRLGLGLG